jgi:hypothetical protein
VRTVKLTIVMFLVTVMIVACIPGTGYAEGDTVFTLTKNTDSALPDQALVVTVNGSN